MRMCGICRRSPSPELEIAADPHLSLNPSPLPSPGAERELFLGDVYPGWRLRLTRGYCLLPRWGKSDGLAHPSDLSTPSLFRFGTELLSVFRFRGKYIRPDL